MSELVSGEGVAIELNRAGVGSRVVAAVIDLAAQFVALMVVIVLDGVVGAGDPDIVAALAIVELVLILAAYPIVFEWLGHGKTLGKLALGLRVVRDDGGPIGFRQALVRGLAGFFLEKPGIFIPPLCTAVGMITLGTSSANKRIGDMMAGTFVVNERAGPRSGLERVALFVPPQLYGWAQSLDLSRLDDQLALQLRAFVLRASEMTPIAQHTLGDQFRSRILAVISPPPPAGVPTATLLVTVLAERRRRADIGAAFGVGPSPYQPSPYRPWPYPPIPYGPTPNAPTPYAPTPYTTAPSGPFTPPS